MNVHKRLELDAPVERAWEVFVAEMGRWWPVATHSHGGAERVEDVVLEPRAGGLLYERRRDGTTVEWADVLVFDAPRRLVLRWRVSAGTEETEIEVRFAARDGGGSLLELDHRGWTDAGNFREYDSGWDLVLGGYSTAAA